MHWYILVHAFCRYTLGYCILPNSCSKSSESVHLEQDFCLSAAAAAQLPGCQEKEATALRRCYVCQEPNHMARDCPRRRGSPRSSKTLICYRCKRQGHVARNCPGNERVFSASLSPRPHLNGALPAFSVQINGVRRTALVDTGCTQTLVRKPCCRT